MQAKQAGPDATMDWAPDLASTTKQHGMTITTHKWQTAPGIPRPSPLTALGPGKLSTLGQQAPVRPLLLSPDFSCSCPGEPSRTGGPFTTFKNPAFSTDTPAQMAPSRRPGRPLKGPPLPLVV